MHTACGVTWRSYLDRDRDIKSSRSKSRSQNRAWADQSPHKENGPTKLMSICETRVSINKPHRPCLDIPFFTTPRPISPQQLCLQNLPQVNKGNS